MLGRRMPMTLGEASERFCISMEKLNYYEENELIRYEMLVEGIPDYTEDELDYMTDRIEKEA